MQKTISSRVRRNFIAVVIVLAASLLPVRAFAHSGGTMSTIAPVLAWGFLAFGAVVITVVSVILFGRNPSDLTPSAEAFAGLSGFQGYIAKMRLFSRNARLFMVHVVGMDVIYGTWSVLFNLYLLAVGFDIAFIGLRILVSSISSAVASIPAGLISDRIGRKLSFVLGDGVGALMSLIAISSASEGVLLVTAVFGGMFGALHGVAEPAFMAENSEDYERVHLFSVSGGTRTAAMIIGAALAGLVPLLVATADNAARIEVYRMVSYVGIAGWFLSLVPAVMLRQIATEQPETPSARSGLFANVKNPDLILKLTLPEVLIGLGAGFALPLMNVFFQSGVGSEEIEISAVFSTGMAFLVVASFLAPLVASKLGKIPAIVLTRGLSIPFILLLAFAPGLGSESVSVLSLAGLAYIGRITLFNMASPVRSAFAMEILDEKERGTQVGIEQAISAALSGGAAYFGAQLMDAGNFQQPFLLMAVFYAVAVAVFWVYFGNQRRISAVEGA